MAFDQGASQPEGSITAKSTGKPQNAWRLKLKKIQRIQPNIDGKKLVTSLFFLLIIFLFSTKSGGGGAKKWWGRGPTSPPPPRSLTNSAFDASLKHDLMSLPDKGKRGRGGSLPKLSLCFRVCRIMLENRVLCFRASPVKLRYYAQNYARLEVLCSNYAEIK